MILKIQRNEVIDEIVIDDVGTVVVNFERIPFDETSFRIEDVGFQVLVSAQTGEDDQCLFVINPDLVPEDE